MTILEAGKYFTFKLIKISSVDHNGVLVID